MNSFSSGPNTRLSVQLRSLENGSGLGHKYIEAPVHKKGELVGLWKLLIHSCELLLFIILKRTALNFENFLSE